MRSYRLARLSSLLLAVLAMFAFGAITATAAQALEEEAPFWSIEGLRLKAGETHNISAKTAKGTGNFKLISGTLTIECPTVKLKEGALVGSEPGNPGTNKEIIEFEGGCKVAGNGTKCPKVKEPIVTNKVLSELVLKVGTQTILTLFKPETGVVFTELTFIEEPGGKCTFKTTKVEGEDVVEVRSDPENTGQSYLLKTLGAEQPEKILLVKNKQTEEVEVKPLRAFGKEVTLAGTALILLANNKGQSELVTWSPLV